MQTDIAVTGKNAQKQDREYLMSTLIGVRVYLGQKKIGRLSDMMIIETGKLPEVKNLIITRPFGDPALLVPWDRVKTLEPGRCEIDLAELKKYETAPPEDAILLFDHILNKKVLDMEDAEVEIVYDIHLINRNGRLYVTEVDTSRSARLRRLGLGFLSGILYPQEDPKDTGVISWMYIQPLPPQISSFRGDVKLNILKDKLADIHPVDLADILEELDHDQRVMVFASLEHEQASDTLEEIEPQVQRDIISSLTTEQVGRLLNDMTPGQAADILSVLPSSEAHEILEALNKDNAKKIQAIIGKQEEKVIHYTTQKILKFLPETTVGYIENDYPRHARGKDVIMYIYVAEKDDTLLGVIDLKELLQADDQALLKDIMIENVISLSTESTLKEASQVFARYDFRALPVIDDKNHLAGVIPYRDVMNLTHHFVE
ncbi:magnesium transporter MgtE N-terminal domain-containing protein [uncultured Methanoregula sp.]|uniref:magnesium transporter MgtE N-terminal domain-containing protein n=1 Tax=uncultured Methanoregula sp. TaxID=1005933 RepID=UPI002AAB0BE4|nr:CBS domain-containing protein [uncultured Methanoregula sp.]